MFSLKMLLTLSRTTDYWTPLVQSQMRRRMNALSEVDVIAVLQQLNKEELKDRKENYFVKLIY